MTVRQSDVVSGPKGNGALRTIGHFIGGHSIYTGIQLFGCCRREITVGAGVEPCYELGAG